MPDRGHLAPCFVDRGTVGSFRDMLRALETIETLEYRWLVDEEIVSEGKATLVKLLADPDSATMVVNGCLFLNVASFRYLDFEPAAQDRCMFRLHGDGTVLEMLALPEENENGERRPNLLLEPGVQDFGTYIALDGDEDELD